MTRWALSSSGAVSIATDWESTFTPSRPRMTMVNTPTIPNGMKMHAIPAMTKH